MRIKFNHLKIKNFMSFDNAEIDFTAHNGFVAVNGINNNPSDSAKSNGSGKSALFDSLCWGLTGETIRGVKDVQNIFIDGDAVVDIEFTYDNHNYHLIRTKGKATNLRLYIDGEDKSGKGIRDTQDILEQNIPDLTTQLIGAVIILGQGLPQRFSNNTPSGRKEVLENLSKSDYMIEDIKTRIAKRKVELNGELQNAHDELVRLKTEKNSYDARIVELNNKLKTTDVPDALRDEVNSLEKEKTTISADLAVLDEKYDMLSDKRDNMRAEYTSVQTKQSEERVKITESFSNDTVNLSAEIAECKAKVTNLQKEIRRIDSIQDTCPTCGQKLAGIVKPSSDNEKTELVLAEKELKSLTTRLADLTNRKDEAIRESDSRYSTTLAEITEIGKGYANELNGLSVTIGEKNKRLKEIENKIILNTARIESWAKVVDDINKEIETINGKSAMVDMLIDSLECTENSHNNHLAIIKKFETIVSRDFRGYLLTNVIDYINSKCAEYASVVFGHADLKLSLDKNNLNITYLSKVYESLSGGEKQKIDIIIQFAIRNMLCRFMDFESNIIVLDEIFDNCDISGCDNILKLIAQKLSDVDNIYIITHHGAELQIPCDYEINVVKGEDNISRIV